MLRYLLSIPGVRAESNAENEMGFTALDIIENSTNDFRATEIRQILMDSGIKRKDINIDNERFK